MVVNPIVGVYIPIIRTPIKGGMSLSPKKTRLLTMAHMVQKCCWKLRLGSSLSPIKLQDVCKFCNILGGSGPSGCKWLGSGPPFISHKKALEGVQQPQELATYDHHGYLPFTNCDDPPSTERKSIASRKTTSSFKR